MKQRPDPFLNARREAERLLQDLGIDSLPIDPFDIADRLDVALRAMPASAGGASGMLIHVQGVFGIAYPTHVENQGFKRFSVGHEVGHYRLPGHIEAVLDERGQHFSRAGFQSANQYEQEADHFSAALLMPTRHVGPIIRTAREGLNAVETIADRCGTSLEAAAIRYTQLCLDPVAVVRSEGPTIDYAFMSNSLRDLPGLDWIRKGSPLHRGCATYAFNQDADNVRFGRRASGESALQDWLGGPHRQQLIEEVTGLGGYGKTLTVLTGMEPPDEVEDDDELERSWTPRFHRR